MTCVGITWILPVATWAPPSAKPEALGPLAFGRIRSCATARIRPDPDDCYVAIGIVRKSAVLAIAFVVADKRASHVWSKARA